MVPILWKETKCDGRDYLGTFFTLKVPKLHKGHLYKLSNFYVPYRKQVMQYPRTLNPDNIKPKRQKVLKYFKTNLKRFLLETSLNGLKYVNDKERNQWERSYYLVSFIITFIMGIYMAVYFLNKWQSTPVIISLNSETTSISDIPFPTVTFCNMNQVTRSKVEDYPEDTPEYAILQKVCFREYNFTRFKNFKPRFAGDTYSNFVVKHAQSCEEMFVFCKYGPNEETCTDLFREIILDEGLCCVFNQVHPLYLYKGDRNISKNGISPLQSPFEVIDILVKAIHSTNTSINEQNKSTLKRLQCQSLQSHHIQEESLYMKIEYFALATTKLRMRHECRKYLKRFKCYNFIRAYTSSNGRTVIPVKWTFENGYSKPLPKHYSPRAAAGLGVSMGLTVVLNASLNDYFCSSTNGPGFKMLLYNPIDFPHIKEAGLPIDLGNQIRVRLNTKITSSSPSLRSISPKDRQCYFSDEKELLFFKYYTRRNCEMECNTKLVFRLCNCIPNYMPTIVANSSVCFLQDMTCVSMAERVVADKETELCKHECLSGCNELTYFPDLFATPLTQRNYKVQETFFANFSLEEIQRDLVQVSIFHKYNYIRGNVKAPYTGLTEFMFRATLSAYATTVSFLFLEQSELFIATFQTRGDIAPL
ncbi:pickpocket protein 28-like [Haematobia irritans]|uniref:pickpocket protein 28-like n=1 Tax=Haematobia irritans TaxID=7368 RepID=UPI003F50BF28